MSYSTWIINGYGICIDDIETTAEKLLKLASMNKDVLKDVREYLDEIYPNGYNDEDLTIDDFNELEGEYCEKGIAYVLYQVIDSDTPIEFAYDYYGVQYILYTPTYPWFMTDADKTLTEKVIENIFKKYVKILTDKDINIDYYSVENGG